MCFEDDVWVTANGFKNLMMCPRAIKEVLNPNVDVLPELKRVWAICRGGKMEMLDKMDK